MLKRSLIALVALTAALMPSVASASALLRITPTGIASSAYVGPTDPVPISPDGFRLSLHGGGNYQLLDPVLLILAIPGTSLTAPTLSVSATSGFVQQTMQLGGASAYGGTWNAATGYAGNFNSSSKGSAYNVANLAGGSPSQNYTNWNAATGLTSWNLFVYQLTFNPNMTPNAPTDWVEFATSTMPTGTFVIGYGQQLLKKGATNVYSTPYTFAGNVQSVPEPTTLSLLGAGMFVAGLVARRRRKS